MGSVPTRQFLPSPAWSAGLFDFQRLRFVSGHGFKACPVLASARAKSRGTERSKGVEWTLLPAKASFSNQGSAKTGRARLQAAPKGGASRSNASEAKRRRQTANDRA